ncbi:hypothetical protein FOA52_001144 [Chlamydomonas sp. UWO 241]|nr:hypothetical protein FOA52_001144 [Chlamydomonas sp. UWO 241]
MAADATAGRVTWGAVRGDEGAAAAGAPDAAGAAPVVAPALHWLPVRLTGAAAGGVKADELLTVRTEEAIEPGGDPVLAATLRGRELRGVERALPDGYVALALERRDGGDGPNDADGGAGKAWAASHALPSLVLWGHDAPPGRTDGAIKAFEFLRAAAGAHARADVGQVEAKLMELRRSRAPAEPMLVV